MKLLKLSANLTSLGLKEAKEMAEEAGAKVMEQVSKEAAQDAKTQLEAAGAVVELA